MPTYLPVAFVLHVHLENMQKNTAHLIALHVPEGKLAYQELLSAKRRTLHAKDALPENTLKLVLIAHRARHAQLENILMGAAMLKVEPVLNVTREVLNPGAENGIQSAISVMWGSIKMHRGQVRAKAVLLGNSVPLLACALK
jgi:hypothetical protein